MKRNWFAAGSAQDGISWRAVRAQQYALQGLVDQLLEDPTKARLERVRSGLHDYLRVEDGWLESEAEVVPVWRDQLERGNQRLWDAHQAIAWDVPSTLGLWRGIKQLRHALI